VNQEEHTSSPAPGGEHPVSRLLFGWAPADGVARQRLAMLGIVCAGLAIADLAIPSALSAHKEKIPALYGVIGFVAAAALLLAGWPLGRLLRRPARAETGQPVASEEGGGDEWRPMERLK
jgi:threonine/homoserine/homoserine lactone efflux protein